MKSTSLLISMTAAILVVLSLMRVYASSSCNCIGDDNVVTTEGECPEVNPVRTTYSLNDVAFPTHCLSGENNNKNCSPQYPDGKTLDFVEETFYCMLGTWHQTDSGQTLVVPVKQCDSGC